jgi:uncharacterized protein DUF2092
MSAPPPAAAPAVLPEALAALEKMGGFLRSLKAFTLRADTSTDEVLDDSGQKIQFNSVVEYRVRPPDRLRADVVSDRKHQQFFYDGKTLTLYGQRVHYYASIPAPPTIRETLTVAAQKYGLEVPLADLSLSSYGRLRRNPSPKTELHHLRRDVTAVSDYVARALALSQELGFPLLHSSASQIQGWVVAVQGDPATGLAQLQQGAMQTTETFVMKPYFLGLQVEVYGMLQQYEAALHLLTDILRMAQAAERHFYDAELYRLQGELLLAQAGPRHQEEAEASLHQALDVARRLLSPLYGWFTEGHETADLQAARAVLEGLS